MRRLALVACLVSVLAPAAARADYLFEIVQRDETGVELERHGWTCSEWVMAAYRCTQGILLMVDGEPEPVDLLAYMVGDQVNLLMRAGKLMLRVGSSKPLHLNSRNEVAAVLELAMTTQPIESGRHDLLLRGTAGHFATVTLIAKRVAYLRPIEENDGAR